MAEYAEPAEVDAVVADLVHEQRERERLRTRKLRYACECSSVTCTEHVSLTQQEYEELRDRRDLILASGHVETPDQRQRRIAAGLCEDSAALRAQAEHLVAHSKEIAAQRQASRDD